jgi:hypothetical protein
MPDLRVNSYVKAIVDLSQLTFAMQFFVYRYTETMTSIQWLAVSNSSICRKQGFLIYHCTVQYYVLFFTS